MLDPATRPPSARAGFAQGRSLAEHLSGFWRPEGALDRGTRRG
jgi:hypothetical protein